VSLRSFSQRQILRLHLHVYNGQASNLLFRWIDLTHNATTGPRRCVKSVLVVVGADRTDTLGCPINHDSKLIATASESVSHTWDLQERLLSHPLDLRIIGWWLEVSSAFITRGEIPAKPVPSSDTASRRG
jgi:hypothetical protein